MTLVTNLGMQPSILGACLKPG